MFCRNCGKETTNGSKYCSKCGKSLDTSTDSKKIEKPRSLFVRIISWSFILLILPAVLFFLILQLDMFPADRQIFAFFVVIAYLSFVIVITLFSRWLKRFPPDKKKLPSLLILPIISLLTVGVVCSFWQLDYIWLANDLPQIQNYLTEEAAAKLIGDSIIAGHSANKLSFTDIAGIAETAEQNLKTFSHSALSTKLDKYGDVSTNWSNQIVNSAKNTSRWKSLPAEPADFKLELSDSKAQALFKTTIQNIQALKEFGDTAIKNKDKETMVYIAAKLLVQKHWLNGLVHAKKVNFLSLKLVDEAMASTLALRVCGPAEPDVRPEDCDPETGCIPHCTHEQPVIPTQQPVQQPVQQQKPVQQAPQAPAVQQNPTEEPTPIPYNYSSETRDICLKGANGTYCAQATIQSATEIEISAIGFAEDKPNAQKQWDDSWHYAETTSGLLQEDPITQTTENAPKNSPIVQAFYDSCKAKGSYVGGANQNKGRLPTTEGGYHCSYRQGANNCWDFLTRSGGRFMGGDVGCTELNLVPNRR